MIEGPRGTQLRQRESLARTAQDVTIADVAAASGVSMGTVSNYLNRPHAVAPGTRERIPDEPSTTWVGVPNVAVRTIRRGYSQLIGLVLSDMDPFFTDVARRVEQAAADAGYAVLLCNSDNDPDRQERYLNTR